MNANNVSSVAWSASRYFTIYPVFNSQFNSDGNFGGWQGHFGIWSVGLGNLYTPGLDEWYTSSASYGNSTFTDFTYTARMKMTTSGILANYLPAYGLIVRGTPTFDAYNDWMNGYYFAIGQVYDATYGEMACYNVYKITNGVWSSQTTNGYWWCNTAIYYDDWNTLEVYASGSTLKFYVNDTLLWSRVISGPTSGRLGVFTWRPSYSATTYVDWATAGMPLLPIKSEISSTSQFLYLPYEDGLIKSKGIR